LKRLPALDRARCEFMLITDDFIMATRHALPEGQGEPPVALFADHPIVHIAQPVEFALETKGRNPANLPSYIQIARRSSSMLMNHSSTRRKTSSTPQRQHVG